MSGIFTRTALGSSHDLVTPTATANYKLGQVVVIEENDTVRPNILAEYIYVRNLQTLAQPFVATILEITDFIGEEYVAGQPGTSLQSTVANRVVCVSQIEIPFNFYAFVKIKGIARCLLNGFTSGLISVGSHLKIRPTTGILQRVDTFDSGSCGISLEVVSIPSQEATILLEGVKVTVS